MPTAKPTLSKPTSDFVGGRSRSNRGAVVSAMAKAQMWQGVGGLRLTSSPQAPPSRFRRLQYRHGTSRNRNGNEEAANGLLRGTRARGARRAPSVVVEDTRNVRAGGGGGGGGLTAVGDNEVGGLDVGLKRGLVLVNLNFESLSGRRRRLHRPAAKLRRIEMHIS